MHLKKLLIDGTDINLVKMAFPGILASPKAQNLIIRGLRKLDGQTGF